MRREGLRLLKRGCCVEAVEALSEATEWLADQADVWALFGMGLVGLDQSLKARACFERSLALLPHQPSLWNNLGMVLLHSGETDRALHAFQQALNLEPDLVAARRNAGLSLFALGRREEAEALLPASSDRCVLHGQALMENGDLEGATESYREAIRLLEQEGVPESGVPGAFTQAGGRRALVAAKERLDSAGISFCLYAGTLLGVVREGDVLAHDKDLDLGVAWEVDREQLVQALCTGGEFTVPWFCGILPQDRPWCRSFSHAGSGCTLDVFFLQREGDTILNGFDSRLDPILCRLTAFGLREWSWMGRRWNVPDPPERYLAEVYGPHWQIPDAHYDTILSNPSRCPESLSMVLCQGYCRLYGALKEGRRAKARALAAQIRARHEDAFLFDLESRLATQLRHVLPRPQACGGSE